MTPADYVEATKGMFPWSDHRKSGEMYAKAGPCFAGFVDGELAAVAGVVLGLVPWGGVGEAWAVLTDLGRAHPLFVHRRVVRALKAIIREHNLHRVQATVLEPFTVGATWCEALGMVQEGRMPRYGPEGETMLRYAWVRP